MIPREPATRLSQVTIGAVQSQRSKATTAKQDDADCFQRLANCDDLTLDAEKNEAPGQVEPVSRIGFAVPVLTILSLQAAAQTRKNEDFATRNYENLIPEPAQPLTKTGLKKPSLNAWIFIEAAAQRHGGIALKPVVLPRGNTDVQNQKAAPKVELPFHENSVENSFDVTSNPSGLVTALMSQNVAQVRTAPLSLTELPHVMRVQIDQVKRNSESVLTSLELVLEPAELGRITARIQYEEGRVTLVLSAEHKHIADDLARDRGLLLRALGDQIPGINRSALFVQTEAQQSNPMQGQLSGDLHSNSREQKQQAEMRGGNNGGAPDVSKDDRTFEINATQLQVLI